MSLVPRRLDMLRDTNTPNKTNVAHRRDRLQDFRAVGIILPPHQSARLTVRWAFRTRAEIAFDAGCLVSATNGRTKGSSSKFRTNLRLIFELTSTALSCRCKSTCLVLRQLVRWRSCHFLVLRATYWVLPSMLKVCLCRSMNVSVLETSNLYA